VDALKGKGMTPGLAVVRVGDDPASGSYVRSKTKAADRLGVLSETFHLPADVGAEELTERMASLNTESKFHGVLLQLPLPDHLDPRHFTDIIDAEKDVDGFTSESLGRLVAGERGFVPATPRGIVEMLKRTGVDPEGKHVVIIGRSFIVGRPLALLLSLKAPLGNATVTTVHTRTPDPGSLTRQADIIVAAAGHPNTVTADMVREGAVVIDVGINRVDDPEAKKGYRLVGDVDFDAVKEVASAITPVPGGVGLMTVAMLMVNTVEAAER
jgi:methylenetetrahydrofolate dehydrogenase (NADP+)/methenyltetrahydrofolate cyclohydrolase